MAALKVKPVSDEVRIARLREALEEIAAPSFLSDFGSIAKEKIRIAREALEQDGA